MSEFKVGDRVKLTFNNDFGTIVDEEEEDCFGKHRQYKVLLDGDSDAVYYSKLSLELVDVNNKTQDQQKIDQLEQRIEKLEKCVMGEQNSLEKCENVSLMSEFTKEEIEAFNYWKDENYKWACKDENGTIHIFKCKPIPYNIEELLKGERENEKRI